MKLNLALFRVCLALLAAGMVACSDDSSESTSALATPKNVRATQTGSTTLSFAWEAVEHATGYHCQLLDANGSTLGTSTVATTSKLFEGLKPSTKYGIRVMADGKGFESSPYSEAVYATTQEAGHDLKPLATPAPRVKSTEGGTVTVEWSAVSNAAAYRYRLSKGDGAMTEETVETTSVTLTLEQGVVYQFAIQAVAAENGDYLDSPYSTAIELKAETAGDRPTPQVALKFPASEQDGVIRAFPGAEGAGMYTTGGRGGKVIHVTNLNDSGAGSLREAVKASGPRIIVFDVAGIIDLKSNLEIKNGDVTIAGQTAPGDGICLRYYSLVVRADNVIIRYLRSRPGTLGDPAKDEDGLDAIWGRNQQHVILDHCSMSWSTDECSSFYANKNFTMQWCLLAESLHNAGHTKGSHGYGGIWGGAPASFHHNLLANHDSRNPRFDSPNTYRENNGDYRFSLEDRRIDYRNNVVYNFCNFPGYGGEGQRYNYVGNTYKWGPASVDGAGKSYKNGEEKDNPGYRRKYFYQVDGKYTTGGKTYDEGAAEIYCDNSNCFDTTVDPSEEAGARITADNRSGFHLNPSSYSSKRKEITWYESPLAIMDGSLSCAVTTHSAAEAVERVAAYAGASLRRDAVDARNARHMLAGTYEAAGSHGSKNGIIDLPGDVGGYPVYQATEEEKQRASVDTDKDGIPDYYETLLGLDRNSAADAAEKTLDPQRLYSNLEVYLHYLVQDIVEAQNQGGDYTGLN